MPQTNYDPFAGVKAIGEAGENISALMQEAHKAEAAMLEKKKMQQGAQFLHEVINHRVEEVGKSDANAAKRLEFAPFLDPVVQHAAMAVEGTVPAAKDYIGLLKGISDKNADRLKPVRTAKGFNVFNPSTLQYEYHAEPEAIKTSLKTETVLGHIGPKGELIRDPKGDAYQLERVINTTTGEPIHETVVGPANKESASQKISDKDQHDLNTLEVKKNSSVAAFVHPEYNLDDILTKGLPKDGTTGPSKEELAKNPNAAMTAMLAAGGGKKVPDDVRKHSEAVIKSITDYEAKAKKLGIDYIPARQQAAERIAQRILDQVGGDPVKALEEAKKQGYPEDLFKE